jgi:hypothetical protein
MKKESEDIINNILDNDCNYDRYQDGSKVLREVHLNTVEALRLKETKVKMELARN